MTSLKEITRKINKLYSFPSEVNRKLTYIQQAIGRMETKLNNEINDISNSEFRVFSQWGEDGIIQFLINNIKIDKKIFIEFGVENYKESNTRFLLTNNNWSGLVIDGNEDNIAFIKSDGIYWQHNLKADANFITKDNINTIISNNGLSDEIGLLSIDIDGNDYWVWDNINIVNPCIVICEYNSLFGNHAMISSPYQEDFIRNHIHYSYVYYGASISALNNLAEKKGYSLVYGNSNGNNVFFIRNDLLENTKIKKISVENAYVKAQFRDSRNKDGLLDYLSFEERLELISEMEIYDFNTNNLKKIKEVI